MRRFVAKYEALLSRLRPGQQPPPLGSVGGTDASRTVSCTIDDHGSVKVLQIEPAWWDVVGPQGIAAAILDAFRFASSKVTAAGMIRAHHGLVDEAVGRHGHQADRDLFDEVLRRGPAEGLDAIWRSLELASAALAAAERNHRAYVELRDRRAERRSVSGPGRLFRLVLSGDEIVAAEARQELLGPRDGPRLAADARAAFGAAHQSRIGDRRS